MRNWIKIISLVFLIFINTGCLNTPSPELADIGDTYVCKSDCKEEWAKAQVWVSKHAITPIITANEVLIQTQQPQFGNKGIIIFTVTKLNNIIKMNMSSSNAMTFIGGYYDDLPKSFYYYLKTSKDIYSPSMFATAVN